LPSPVYSSSVYPSINKKSLKKASTQRGEFVGMKKARRGIPTESGVRKRGGQEQKGFIRNSYFILKNYWKYRFDFLRVAIKIGGGG
jgi:hypothetical protein